MATREDDARVDAESFDARCATIVRLLRRQNERTLDAGEERDLAAALSSVTASLPRLIARREIRDVTEPADLAQEALARFVRAAAAGMVRTSGSPAGYLMRTAMNVLADLRRRPALPVPEADVNVDPAGDGSRAADDAVALLDRLASRDTVREGLRRAAADGDDTTVAVVGAWLDLAHARGSEPTLREVADAVGVKHTSVARCLKRFRVLLGEAAG